MDAISQTTFSSVFSWMKMFEFWLKFRWSLFLRFQLIIFQHWFRYWLGVVQATSHYLNQWWLVYWRIYASLGLNELMGKQLTSLYNMIYRRYADVWSHPGHYLVHPPTPPWTWMDESHPFHTISMGPSISEIRLFQTFILTLQGHGHRCGQRAWALSLSSI